MVSDLVRISETSKLYQSDSMVFYIDNPNESSLSNIGDQIKSNDEETKDGVYLKGVIAGITRSPVGRHYVEVKYWKRNDLFYLSWRENRSGAYEEVTRTELMKRLQKLKESKENGLYIRVVFPEDAGLTFKEAFELTNKLHKEFDYYFMDSIFRSREMVAQANALSSMVTLSVGNDDNLIMQIYGGETLIIRDGEYRSAGIDSIDLKLTRKNSLLLSKKEFRDAYKKQNEREGRFQKQVTYETRIYNKDYERYKLQHNHIFGHAHDYWRVLDKVNEGLTKMISYLVAYCFGIYSLYWVYLGFAKKSE